MEFLIGKKGVESVILGNKKRFWVMYHIRRIASNEALLKGEIARFIPTP